jgi:hypothetical protein
MPYRCRTGARDKERRLAVGELADSFSVYATHLARAMPRRRPPTNLAIFGQFPGHKMLPVDDEGSFSTVLTHLSLLATLRANNYIAILSHLFSSR